MITILPKLNIQKIKFRYNSLYALESEVSVELAAGKVFYKSNMDNPHRRNYHSIVQCSGRLSIYECFFLINPDMSQRFAKYAERLLQWQPYYGTGRCIDGQYWSLHLILSDGSIKEFIGENGKPDDFKEFVGNLEMLVGKPIECNFH
jgi:hypothetical protein